MYHHFCTFELFFCNKTLVTILWGLPISQDFPWFANDLRQYLAFQQPPRVVGRFHACRSTPTLAMPMLSQKPLEDCYAQGNLKQLEVACHNIFVYFCDLEKSLRTLKNFEELWTYSNLTQFISISNHPDKRGRRSYLPRWKPPWLPNWRSCPRLFQWCNPVGFLTIFQALMALMALPSWVCRMLSLWGDGFMFHLTHQERFKTFITCGISWRLAPRNTRNTRKDLMKWKSQSLRPAVWTTEMHSAWFDSEDFAFIHRIVRDYRNIFAEKSSFRLTQM